MDKSIIVTVKVEPITYPKLKEGMLVLWGETLYTLHQQDRKSGHWNFGTALTNEGLEPEFDGYGNRTFIPVQIVPSF